VYIIGYICLIKYKNLRNRYEYSIQIPCVTVGGGCSGIRRGIGWGVVEIVLHNVSIGNCGCGFCRYR